MTNEEQDQHDFRIFARNRGIEGFTYEIEGQWKGAFWFIQAADTQLGMMDSYLDRNSVNPGWEREVKLFEKLVQFANASNPKPRFLIICGDLVDATPRTLKGAQIKDFKRIFAKLDDEIKPICVCGNHDIGDRPTVDDIMEYRSNFGDDFFSFWVGGVKFLTFNSQYFVDDRAVKELRREHDAWIDQELHCARNKNAKHLVGFQHIPPFVINSNEQRVEVPGTNLSFNFCDLTERRSFLDKMKNAGMTKLFCGHYHRNAGGWDGDLEVIVTSAVGCQLGDDDHGFRIVNVDIDSITHHYHSLSASPIRKT